MDAVKGLTERGGTPTAPSANEAALSLASALRGEPLDATLWQPEHLVVAAEEHGITAVLWERLRADGRSSGALSAALEAPVQRLAARELFLQRDMRTLLTALAASAVPALVVKGSALAYTIYPRPYLRPRLDTDLLIRKTDVQRAVAVLHDCGYSEYLSVDTNSLLRHQVVFERTDALGIYQAVDLHWKLANPHALADALPFDLLWDGSHAVPALGPHARVPSPAASIVLACMHRLAHHQRQDRLIWLYDLKLLTASFAEPEWLALRALASSRGVASLSLDGLRRAKRWLDAPLPEDVETALATAAAGEKSSSYAAGPVRNRDVLISDLKVLPTWRARVQLLREHILPPAGFMRQRYRGMRWPLPGLYLHRLLTAIVKWARE